MSFLIYKLFDYAYGKINKCEYSLHTQVGEDGSYLMVFHLLFPR